VPSDILPPRDRRDAPARDRSARADPQADVPWPGSGGVMRDLAIFPRALPGPAAVGAVERAAASFARLDQALTRHPLRPAFLYRTRLEAVRRQAAVDGLAIDPWHLAAVLEGFRLRMDGALRIIDRGMVFEAARHALALHQWLVAPDFDQEGEVQRAEQALGASVVSGGSSLLDAARGVHAWLDQGESRPPIRAALVRAWVRRRLLCAPVPLTGPKALAAGVPFQPDAWLPIFLDALADEADDALQLLFDMERRWVSARAAVAGRRRTSRAVLAVDVLAAAPLLSATTLAAAIGMSVKHAIALLDGFLAAGIVVEVTHRAKRRLFGLAGLAPLRDQVAPPRRPEPGRGRGRPPIQDVAAGMTAPPPLPPLGPIERRKLDYSDLEHWVAHSDQVVRTTRRALERLAQGSRTSLPGPVRGGSQGQSDVLADAGSEDGMTGGEEQDDA
jgi:hypothetical protein